MPTVVYGLLFTIGIMGVLTPYGTGPAPIYYSAGYISTKEFWRLGLITGTIYIIAVLLLGVPFV